MSGLATDQIDEYLAEVAARLEGLPAAERQELLDDLRAHLVEVAAEGGSLGPPGEYAAELVRSAGLRPTAPRRPWWRTIARGWWIAAAVVVALVLATGVTGVSHTQPVQDVRPADGPRTTAGR